MQRLREKSACLGIVAQFGLKRRNLLRAQFSVRITLGQLEQSKLISRLHASAPSSLSSFSTQVSKLIRMRLSARYTAPTVLRMRSATPSISRSS